MNSLRKTPRLQNLILLFFEVKDSFYAHIRAGEIKLGGSKAAVVSIATC